MTVTDHTSPRLYTVGQFAFKHCAFTEPSLRWMIFNASKRSGSKGDIPGNGLEVALVRVGRRVLIDETKFFEWLGA